MPLDILVLFELEKRNQALPWESHGHSKLDRPSSRANTAKERPRQQQQRRATKVDVDVRTLKSSGPFNSYRCPYTLNLLSLPVFVLDLNDRQDDITPCFDRTSHRARPKVPVTAMIQGTVAEDCLGRGPGRYESNEAVDMYIFRETRHEHRPCWTPSAS